MCAVISEQELLSLSEKYCYLESDVSYLIFLLRNVRIFGKYVSGIEGDRGVELTMIAHFFDELICDELCNAVNIG